MLKASGDVLDRTPSGRFVRNLALSISGGALLTLIGAGVAQANEAGTASGGQGAAGTGDANAVGNRSGTTATQGATVSTGTGNIQIINQNAGVANVGVAVANTGGNLAVGNVSNNDASTDQALGGGPLGLAMNNGSASNTSGGRALIQTGGADAIGNDSTTTLDQRAGALAHGTLGGVLVLSQDALVLNAGFGLANSGLNAAVGNASGQLGTPNTAGLLQTASKIGGPGGVSNNGRAGNDTDGHATISTGNASSVGNRAHTKVSQIAGSGGDGDDGGLDVITQLGGALNAGVAIGNTGVNGAVGNASTNVADVTGALPDGQDVDVDVTGVGFGTNSGSATNAADGTAWITTGDATAIGSDARTAIVQDANAELGEGGVHVQTQLAPVLNVGLGIANTGVNGAVGNVSQSGAATSQAAFGRDGGGAALLGLVNNSGEASNASDGTASIHSGDASAHGNRSATDVSQWIEATGDDLAVQTEGAPVVNAGVAVANTGVNGAIGNASDNAVALQQRAELDPLDLTAAMATVSNSGVASNDSNGAASIATGHSSASGNESTTRVGQAIDPTGTAVQTQGALVVNAGLGVSNSGVNGAVGNASINRAPNDPGALLVQGATVDIVPELLAGVATVSNHGDASNTSNGSASITTGGARSVGNRSDTGLRQHANATIEGQGGVVNTQVGVVANLGSGVANTGMNGAVGNRSTNIAAGTQLSEVADSTIDTGVFTASNAGSVLNGSEGTATIATGDAEATGNVSVTDVEQAADGTVAGLGLAVSPQVGTVVNAGRAVASSGGNVAVGNISHNDVVALQRAQIGDGEGGGLLLTAPVVSNVNSIQVGNASDGTAEVHTGDAMARGNSSDTRLAQRSSAHVAGMGAVTNTQDAGVVNVGQGLANSGINGAVGNASNRGDGGQFTFDAVLQQEAYLGNTGGSTPELVAGGPVTNGNSASVGNTSNGWGYVHTGDTQAQGNVSATALNQDATGNVGEDGTGIVPNLQVAGVLNRGTGVANSGINGAVGNASGSGLLPPLVPLPIGSENEAALFQTSTVAGDAGALIVPVGPVTNHNAAEVRNTSDGTGKVLTGDALATGNVSSTNLNQSVRGNVDGLGLVIGPQLGVVTNVGVGVANSGVNGAFGNASNNTANSEQASTFTTPDPLSVFGPVTAGNTGATTNTSDGDACVCTGDAVATGNVSTSTLSQDLHIGVDDGLSVVPMTGIILNAGFGLANSGVNGAVGNLSQNLATSTQTATLDPTVTSPLVGPQTIVNGGGADNASNGTGKVGTGDARADGNLSTSDLVQGVSVDGAGAFAQVNGGIGNVGAAVANSGVNAGIGNASSNIADLDQTATGSGTVSNQGRASNASDGFGGVGDPDCEVPGDQVATPDEPGVPTLPKTGGPVQVEAALALMMLLAGFTFRRLSQAAAARA
ncbi:MAG: hypothetical protein M3Z03_05750 [Actinomycetota bacterium]|nr:hypothetical protein [Actinomycetota bacterium]